MLNSVSAILITAALTAAPAAPASASQDDASRVAAQPANATTGTVFRINEADATVVEGCFNDCACPLFLHGQLRGTFVLGPVQIGDAVDFREVREINWFVINDNNNGDAAIQRITGSGVYRRTNFGAPVTHALDLDLSIDGADPVHFFSDFIPVTSNTFTIEIPVSMNGLACYDTLIEVHASPVPQREITHYRVHPRTSTWQQGCFDPCDCPLSQEHPLGGRFALVPISEQGTYVEYAMVGVHLRTRAAQNSNAGIRLDGFGRYTLIQGFAGPIQAVELELSTNGGPLEHFDSELENIPAIFPRIMATVDTNEQVCFDTVLRIDAGPVNAPDPANAK